MDQRFQLAFECQEAWEEMREVAPGERRCEQCSETVVDLSRMTKKRALAVVTSAAPPCVSYLVRGDEPIFSREVARGGLLAAAAGLLAACSTPAEEPSCELAPEPVGEVSLLDPSAGFGPLPVESTAGAPVPSLASPQNGGPLDTAMAGDANDVDGATVTPVSGSRSPGNRVIPISRVRGRMPAHFRHPVPSSVSPGDRNDL